MEIVTVDSPLQKILKIKTEDIRKDEFSLAREVSEKLFSALSPYLPATGLAAPQIGISKSVFIYSYDRDPKNLETVINPKFVPVNDEIIESWEGCLSVILSQGIWKLAKIPRYKVIQVNYFTLTGEKVEKILEEFAAKVFQHEYDHLQGIENINRKDALVKTFDSKKALLDFLQEVKKEDETYYKKPHSS